MAKQFTRALAGFNDLLFGKGSEEQTRNNTSVSITKLSIVWPTETLSELKALDTTKQQFSLLITASLVTCYIYDSTSTVTADDDAVVEPNVGTGRWLKRSFS